MTALSSRLSMTWRITAEGTRMADSISARVLSCTSGREPAACTSVTISSRSPGSRGRSSMRAWGSKAATVVRICCKPRSSSCTERWRMLSFSPCSRSVWVAVSSPASGLLISCATAAVMRPTAASRSADSARASAFFRSCNSPISCSTASPIRLSSGSAVRGSSARRMAASTRPIRSMTRASCPTGRVMR